MRQVFRFFVAGLCAVLMGWGTQSHSAPTKEKPSEEATCGEHGTSLHFEKTPSDAAKKALKEQKLVFVLHISGLFEDPDFT